MERLLPILEHIVIDRDLVKSAQDLLMREKSTELRLTFRSDSRSLVILKSELYTSLKPVQETSHLDFQI
jgi:hypothetical protein